MEELVSGVRAVAAVALAAVATLGCGDMPESVGPDSFTPSTVVAMSQGDSVQWSNNVLEMVVDGDTIRWERDQQDATEVAMYLNGVLQVELYP